MNWKKLLFHLALPLGVGVLSSLVSGGTELYQAVVQPPFSPPGWVFPVVWTVLYLLMGYSAYRISVSNAGDAEKRNALRTYYTQLAVNFLWSPVFFGFQWYLAAFFVLIGLWLLVLRTIRLFSPIDETASNLLLPYLLWCSFALYLNFGIYLLN